MYVCLNTCKTLIKEKFFCTVKPGRVACPALALLFFSYLCMGATCTCILTVCEVVKHTVEHVTHYERVARVYSRAQPCEISAIWKKMLHKIYVATPNGTPQKIDPRISTFLFSNKVFKNITDNNTDLTATL